MALHRRESPVYERDRDEISYAECVKPTVKKLARCTVAQKIAQMAAEMAV